ncbi:ADP-heptose synthase / D-glycero-beta-D-manno-heptose 7-phosphate kinase [hydrothermal vent metagenome]|uniref:D-glycero-beta-D-manno-heptose 1-phosphate adenylyltransferase n=1 Tax=hydrothermal vent metagenome TaxID=652676 RepID=A0A3B1E4Z1_9ZZZZ
MKHNKILKLATLKRKVVALRKQGEKIAWTNGCFDILHLGHVSYLQMAKKKDRSLIVGLNSDKSVKKIKGAKRPIVPENERAGVLAGLECVDYIVLFDEATPQKCIEALKPDVLIKGADWKGKGVVGSDFVASYGGKMEYIEFIKNCSSTNIIEKILKKFNDK